MKLVGACGIYCGDCDVRLAYEQNNQGLKERIAQKIGVKPEDIKCDGCGGDMKVHWHSDCPVLNCAKEKGVTACFQCGEFICNKLNSHFQDPKIGPGVRISIVRMKDIGIDKWLQEASSGLLDRYIDKKKREKVME